MCVCTLSLAVANKVASELIDTHEIGLLCAGTMLTTCCCTASKIKTSPDGDGCCEPWLENNEDGGGAGDG